MKEKYVKDNNILRYKAKSGDSSTWKGILKSLHKVAGGFGWKIGNGQGVSFWFDHWIAYDPLCILLDNIDSRDFHLRVADVVDTDGEWALNRLHTKIPPNIVTKILSVKVVTGEDNRDTPSWKGNSNGTITAKSFFEFLNMNEEVAEDSNSWKWVWKLNCPKKIRYFIWLILHERMPTNSYRNSIGIALTDICQRCNQYSESILHVLRDCLNSKAIWNNLIPPRKLHSFYDSQLVHWIKSNVHGVTGIGSFMNTDWPTMFLSLTWHIWKGRNEEVFENKIFSVLKVSKLGSTYATDIQISMNQFQGYLFDPVNGGWSKPPPGYTKLNVDGGFRDGQGTFGGVFRDAERNMLWGFSGKSNAGDALHAEIIVMKIGLQTLLQKDCSRILVEIDSTQTFNLLHGTPDELHPWKDDIWECKKLKQSLWNCDVDYVPRSANRCADAVAKFGYTKNINDAIWLDVIPFSIGEALLYDMYLV